MDVKLAEIAKKAQKRSNRSNLEQIIQEMCAVRALEREEIARFINRTNRYVRSILRDMVVDGVLRYKYPEMINHPRQAYISTKGV